MLLKHHNVKGPELGVQKPKLELGFGYKFVTLGLWSSSEQQGG